MSLAPQEIKTKRFQSMKTGLHIATIHDILYLRNAAKQPVTTSEGFFTLIVMFKNENNEIHEKHYLLDGSVRQKSFETLLAVAQVESSEGGNPKKKDAIGKKLWIAIKEVHYMDNGISVTEYDQPKIDYFIFKVSSYIEDGKRPNVTGDPFNNGGIASGLFIDFKNTSIISEDKLLTSIKKLTPSTSYKEPEKEIVEQPNFGDPVDEVKSGESITEDKDFNWDDQPSF